MFQSLLKPTAPPGQSSVSLTEALRAVQNAWQSAPRHMPGVRPLLIRSFDSERVRDETQAKQILDQAAARDAQSWLRERRSRLGFEKLRENRVLEDFEFGFPDDEDDSPEWAAFAIGDEDDDELERHDAEVEDEEYVLLDMQDDDDDIDVTDEGDDPEGEEEWSLLNEAPESPDVWAQVLASAMEPPAGSAERGSLLAAQPLWPEPWHLPAHYGLAAAQPGSPDAGPEPAELAAVLRYWWRKWGAHPVLAGPDLLICLVERVPTARKELRTLAEELLAFNPPRELSSRLLRLTMQDIAQRRPWVFRWG
jgi:hypothetical protein